MGVAKLSEDRRTVVFEVAYSMWTERRLTREQAAAPEKRRAGRSPREKG